MKELLERLSKISNTVVIVFVWMILAFILMFAGALQYGVFFAIVALIFAVLSLRE